MKTKRCKEAAFILLMALAMISGAAAQQKLGRAAEADSIESLLAEMTLEEKVGQLIQAHPPNNEGDRPAPPEVERMRNGGAGSYIWVYGAEKTRNFQKVAVEESRLGIPLIFGLDVIHGQRTILPVPLAEACSWDPELARQSARLAAVEAAAQGVHWTFAPMVDIARDPRWGRIVEGAGEDPYLGAVFAAARVRGFQGDDLAEPDTILACAKHFAAYGAAEGGRDYNTVDISERTLREIYLPPFRAAVDAGAGSIMSAFNDIAGVPATASRFLLTDILRDEWGFDGYVVSDWHSVVELMEHGVAGDREEAARLALLAGTDMEMTSYAYESLSRQAAEELISEQAIDRAVLRVLLAKQRLGLFDDPFVYHDAEREARVILSEEHRAFARDAARRSIVLLKNEDGLLPLDRRPGKVALVGALAADGATALGPWSPVGQAEDAVTVLDALRERLGEANVIYRPAYDLEDDDVDRIDEAMEAVEEADVVLLALGEPASMSAEDRSRASIELPSTQRRLAEAVFASGKPVAVLLINGRPMAIPEVAEKAPAILETWFLGVEMGPAVADVLFGDYNPGGKLTATFPRATGQVPWYYNHRNTGRPANPAKSWTSRYIDLKQGPVYHFGHGLSYTRFEYAGLEVIGEEIRPGDELKIAFTLKNVGERAGDEVVQLYMRDLVATVAQPVKRLIGFKRASLEPGQSVRVAFAVPADAFGFLDKDLRPVIEPGEIQLMVGSSSADIRLEKTVRIVGEKTEVRPPGTVFSSAEVR